MPLLLRRSKKYQQEVKKSGEPAPAPIVTLRKVEDTSAQQAQQAQQQQAAAKGGPGFTVKPAVKSAAAAAAAAEQPEGEGDEEEEVDEGSDWETASEEEMQTDEKVGWALAEATAGMDVLQSYGVQQTLEGGVQNGKVPPASSLVSALAPAACLALPKPASAAGPCSQPCCPATSRQGRAPPAVHQPQRLPCPPPPLQWEEWDVRRSLFDNRQSASMEENLEYMFKNFGFYFPDSQYLSDPEGLLKYLVRLPASCCMPAGCCQSSCFSIRWAPVPVRPVPCMKAPARHRWECAPPRPCTPLWPTFGASPAGRQAAVRPRAAL